MAICSYNDGNLQIEGFCLSSIADMFGTPCYIYSRAEIEDRFFRYKKSFGSRPHTVCYAVKANSNLSVLKILKNVGSGFDIVSGGELDRVSFVGGSSEQIVFSGVGKSTSEIENSIKARVGCINVESLDELERISGLAEKLGVCAPIAVRVNPNINPKTHPYISTGLKENKFGIPMEEAREFYRRIAKKKSLKPVGIACHIGSQLTSLEPVVEALGEIVLLAEELKSEGIVLNHIDCGGGLGIRYQSENPPSIEAWVAMLKQNVPESYRIYVEPGRSIVGPAGVLLTKIEYIKNSASQKFAVVDAAMNDLLRPALYGADHKVLPCAQAQKMVSDSYDLVGPVCETGDWLAKSQEFSATAGDLVAIMDTGAYGFVMASNYNSRPKIAEVLIEKDGACRLIRSRESFNDLVSAEVKHLVLHE